MHSRAQNTEMAADVVPQISVEGLGAQTNYALVCGVQYFLLGKEHVSSFSPPMLGKLAKCALQFVLAGGLHIDLSCSREVPTVKIMDYNRSLG